MGGQVCVHHPRVDIDDAGGGGSAAGKACLSENARRCKTRADFAGDAIVEEVCIANSACEAVIEDGFHFGKEHRRRADEILPMKSANIECDLGSLSESKRTGTTDEHR